MKTPKSLFLTAAKKYTSFSSDVKQSKKLFLEELTSTMSATDLNKVYSGNDDKSKVATAAIKGINTDTNTSYNPGGHENSQAAPSNNPAASAPNAQANSAPPGTIDLTNPNLVITDLPDGRRLFEDPTNPTQPPFIQSKEDVQKFDAAKKVMQPKLENVSAYGPTFEDIMSALTTLSTGEVLNSPLASEDNDPSMGLGEVKPSGDTLAPMNKEKGEKTDEAMDEPVTSTSSELSMPSGNSSMASSSSSNSPMSASSTDSNATTSEKTDNNERTGVDDSYVQEKGGPGQDEENKKEFTKGAGEAKPQAMNAGSSESENENSKETSNGSTETEWVGGTAPSTECGTSGNMAMSEIEPETNPSGKDSAFWVPGDDLLGLKDIIGSVAKSNGVPDAQETIGKDASGNLVKKPTTNTHQVMPNMRQYVRTNPPPGNSPMMPNAGIQQPVDISDLDSVMGMDTKQDKALNISLNFNF